MTASAVNFTSLILFTFLLATGQALFKSVALRVAGIPMPRSLWFLATQPSFIAALALYGGSTLLWIWILGRVPLSQAYPWVSLGMLIVPAIGVLVFGEQLRPTYWLGAGLIVAGIILTQFGATSGNP